MDSQHFIELDGHKGGPVYLDPWEVAGIAPSPDGYTEVRMKRGWVAVVQGSVGVVCQHIARGRDRAGTCDDGLARFNRAEPGSAVRSAEERRRPPFRG